MIEFIALRHQVSMVTRHLMLASDPVRVAGTPSSLLKNLNSSGQRICFRFSSSYKRSVRFGSECSRLVATLSL